MSILFSDARFNTRAHRGSRSSTGLWLSVVVHATFAGILTAVVPTRASEKTTAARPRSMSVFTLPAPEPVMARSIPIEAPRLPPPPVPVPSRPKIVAAIAELPKPVAVAPIAAKPVEPVRAAILPAAAPVLPLEAKAPERPPETGLFERTNATRTNQSAAAVTTGGFGSTGSSSRGAINGPSAVTTGGFGSVAAAPRATNGSAEVQTAGFDRAASAPVKPSAAAVALPIDRPVEIVFKPTPEYTDDARSARIEGTVTLDLEFTAAGDVRVLRVVRGLGHGLDEAAERAALRIRFKPAQSGGRAVDSRATVHITFRLS